jgi:hypothetical protein
VDFAVGAVLGYLIVRWAEKNPRAALITFGILALVFIVLIWG